MSKLHLILLVLLVVFTSAQTNAETDDTTILNNKTEAVKVGCHFVPLKAQDKISCVLMTFDSHEAIIKVYDPIEDGKYLKAEQITITSWYQEAKIHFEDLTGNGTVFILVEFEGNGGTGVLQKVLSIIDWRNNKLSPVLLGTLSYHYSQLANSTDLIVEYNFKNKGTEKVSLTFDYKFEKSIDDKKTFGYKWADTFKWDNRSRMFAYEAASAKTRKDRENPIAKRIHATRENFFKLQPNMKNLNFELVLDELQIGNILDDVLDK